MSPAWPRFLRRTLAGLLLGGPAMTHAADHPGTTLARLGTIPAAATAVLAVPAMVDTSLGRSTTIGPTARDLSDAAVGMAPWGLTGGAMLVGGGLWAHHDLTTQGIDAPAWAGVGAGGLYAASLGTGLAAASAASPADRYWMWASGSAWMSATGLGIAQLHQNKTARLSRGGAGPMATYDAATGTYHTGTALLAGGALGVVPFAVLLGNSDRRPLLEATAGAGLGLAGLAMLAGTPVRAVGAGQEAEALGQLGVRVDTTPLATSWTAMIAAPALVGVGAAAVAGDAPVPAAGAFLGAAVATVLAPVMAGVQHRRNEAARAALPTLPGQSRAAGASSSRAGFFLPPLHVSRTF